MKIKKCCEAMKRNCDMKYIIPTNEDEALMGIEPVLITYCPFCGKKIKVIE